MLQITNLECVRGNRTLFRDLSFAVRQGDCFRLTGANGSGKTSLLRMLCGLLTPTSGTICWQGTEIQCMGEDYCSAVTYIGHRPGMKGELTSLENLQVACGLNGIEVARHTAIEALQRLGLGGREHLAARFLSEGQCRRLAIARLILCPAELWLLDEVLTSLDQTAIDIVHFLIEEHLERGGMAVVATHQELSLSTGRCQRIELAA